jgi:hypothetical protein
MNLGNASFCPRCGRDLKSISTHRPTIRELRTFESQIAEILPRLREMRERLNKQRREAMASGHQAANHLIQRRLALWSRIERRLEGHLQRAKQLLRDAG